MNYTIPNLFLEAFGLRVTRMYAPEIAKGKPNEPHGLYTGIEFIDELTEDLEISGIGTPIMFPIRFLEGTYNKFHPITGEIIKIKKNEFRLPITSIVSFSRDKEIVTTNLNGSRSTAKESINFNDWQVTINGILIDDNSQPQGFTTALMQEKELCNWEQLVSSIPVICKVFEVREIKNITIRSISFEPIRGRPNVRNFTIDAVSDEPIEMIIC